MRKVQYRQMQFGQVAIEDIRLDPKSRDDIPAVLKGLQYLHTGKREELSGLLEAHIRPGTDRKVGRPGHRTAGTGRHAITRKILSDRRSPVPAAPLPGAQRGKERRSHATDRATYTVYKHSFIARNRGFLADTN